MPINIKDSRTDAVIRELAAATGEPITDAVRVAVEERLERVRRRPPDDALMTIGQIIARGRGRSAASSDRRSAEEIIGYDEHGIPA